MLEEKKRERRRVNSQAEGFEGGRHGPRRRHRSLETQGVLVSEKRALLEAENEKSPAEEDQLIDANE